MIELCFSHDHDHLGIFLIKSPGTDGYYLGKHENFKILNLDYGFGGRYYHAK